MKLTSKLRKAGTTYVFTVKKTYVADGHLTVGKTYNLTAESVHDAEQPE